MSVGRMTDVTRCAALALVIRPVCAIFDKLKIKGGQRAVFFSPFFFSLQLYHVATESRIVGRLSLRKGRNISGSRASADGRESIAIGLASLSKRQKAIKINALQEA